LLSSRDYTKQTAGLIRKKVQHYIRHCVTSLEGAAQKICTGELSFAEMNTEIIYMDKYRDC